MHLNTIEAEPRTNTSSYSSAEDQPATDKLAKGNTSYDLSGEHGVTHRVCGYLDRDGESGWPRIAVSGLSAEPSSGT